MVVGTPGGPTIITQVYHVITNVIDHGMSLADAVAAPRLHHQALPDRVLLEEGGFPPAVVAGLEAMGHRWPSEAIWAMSKRSCGRPRVGWARAIPRRGGGGVGR